jgi:hypothetical protein
VRKQQGRALELVHTAQVAGATKSLAVKPSCPWRTVSVIDEVHARLPQGEQPGVEHLKISGSPGHHDDGIGSAEALLKPISVLLAALGMTRSPSATARFDAVHVQVADGRPLACRFTAAAISLISIGVYVVSGGPLPRRVAAARSVT